VTWVLSHPEITGIATAGDVRLLKLYVEAEKASAELTPEQVTPDLAAVPDYSSPFLRMAI
jgi:hypothetical protein